jgi:hypothetical protein
MAEAVGLAASIIAIGGAAATVLKSSSLYKLADDFETASEDIDASALDIRIFGRVVHIGQRALDRHLRKYPQSPVLEYMMVLSVLGQLAEQSKRTTRTCLPL